MFMAFSHGLLSFHKKCKFGLGFYIWTNGESKENAQPHLHLKLLCLHFLLCVVIHVSHLFVFTLH
jgi:hypothetical protein